MLNNIIYLVIDPYFQIFIKNIFILKKYEVFLYFLIILMR
jgi:hypothetical protein